MVCEGGGGDEIEALHEAAVSGVGCREGGTAFAGDDDEAFGPTAALGVGVAFAEGDEALVFHAVERGVERAGGGVAAGVRCNFREDGDSVGLIVEAQGGEEDDLLKFTEIMIWLHMNYKVCLIGLDVKRDEAAPKMGHPA